jgi:hypothetical protein
MNNLIRWRIDERVNTKRVLYFYSRIWNGHCKRIIKEALGHEDYDVRQAGEIDQHGKMINVTDEDKSVFMVDKAPGEK